MDIQTLSIEATELHADLCSALADPKRILILYALADQPMTVNDLAAKIGVPQPTASRHLKLLRERALVRTVRQGASIEYHLAQPRLIDALDILRSVLRDRLQHRASLLEITPED